MMKSMALALVLAFSVTAITVHADETKPTDKPTASKAAEATCPHCHKKMAECKCKDEKEGKDKKKKSS